MIAFVLVGKSNEREHMLIEGKQLLNCPAKLKWFLLSQESDSSSKTEA